MSLSFVLYEKYNEFSINQNFHNHIFSFEQHNRIGHYNSEMIRTNVFLSPLLFQVIVSDWVNAIVNIVSLDI